MKNGHGLGVQPTFGGRLMFPSDYLAAVEFQGRDVTLTIATVLRDKLRVEGGATEDAFLLTFKETKKKLVLNKTNARSIATALKQPAAEKWVGGRVTLFPTQCLAFGETVACIRVREKAAPAKGTKPAPTPEPAADLDQDQQNFLDSTEGGGNGELVGEGAA